MRELFLERVFNALQGRINLEPEKDAVPIGFNRRIADWAAIMRNFKVMELEDKLFVFGKTFIDDQMCPQPCYWIFALGAPGVMSKGWAASIVPGRECDYPRRRGGCA